MKSRRDFLKLGSALGVLSLNACSEEQETETSSTQAATGVDKGPIALSTWKHGVPANEEAWSILQNGGSAVDAAEKGVMVTERDQENRSVGLWGRPDRDGYVTLDACIQGHDGEAGSVAFLEHFQHPISIARKVMEETPHVMLVGKGARLFALEQGFKEKFVDNPTVHAEWEQWLRDERYEPVANIENHDTIGLLCRDQQGKLAGSCTTSGMAFKRHGRVGDSPIIGAGLFVDGDVGAATATGVGELMIKVAGAHSVVEAMRYGMSPEEACRSVIHRITKKFGIQEGMQVGFLAIDKLGNFGAWSIYEGFEHAVTNQEGTGVLKAGFEQKW